MDKDQIMEEIEKRAAAALMDWEEAKKKAGPCVTFYRRGKYVALQDLLEDIKSKRT